MGRIRWFDRKFAPDVSLQLFPDLVERLRGTPARLEERVGALEPAARTSRVDEQWSIQENVGHLGDLEPLWSGRVEDLMNAAPRLRPADLENRATHQANHNDVELAALLGRFRSLRAEWVGRVETFADEALRRTALHPRLEQPMSVVDLAFFVAEHDDHHLARISEILRVLAQR